MEDSEHTDQQAAQVASAPPVVRGEDEAHGDQAEGGQKQSNMDRTIPASQRREEAGKLQEDRSKAVIAKAIAEAPKAVEKASAEAQSYTAEICEGSDDKLSSRMISPIEQFWKSIETNLSISQKMMRDEESDEDEAKKPATRDTVHGDRSTRRDEVNKAKMEKAPQQYNAKHLTEKSCSQSRSIQKPMQLSNRGKPMVWPSIRRGQLPRTWRTRQPRSKASARTWHLSANS